MHLSLSPSRGRPGQTETRIAVVDDVLTVDGVSYDLGPVPEGGQATAPDGAPFVGPITRKDGRIFCTIRVTLGDDAAPTQPDDPAHWVIDNASGNVIIPATHSQKDPSI